jgi:adenylate kinase family enzyme
MSDTVQIFCGPRTVIIGNSGSGKSTFAARLASRLNCPAIDLDLLHWRGDGFGQKRDEAEARQLVANAAAEPRWIIEGVYGWLAQVAIPRATGLVWLDLPWDECKASLIARGPRRGGDDAQFGELLAWGEGYSSRTTSSSFEGHRQIFDAFAAAKQRLRSRKEAAEFLEQI